MIVEEKNNSIYQLICGDCLDILPEIADKRLEVSK